MDEQIGKIPQIEVQETPVNCPVCPPCPVPPKTKPGKAFFKVLFLFILALILAAVILIGSGFQIVRKESLLDIWLARNQAPTPTVAIEPTPTPDPTADWKTYTNTIYKYSVKYPSNVIFTEGPGDKDKIHVIYLEVRGPNYRPDTELIDGFVITIAVIKNSDNKTPTQFAQDAFNEASSLIKNNIFEGNLDECKTTNVVRNNISSVRFNYCTDTPGKGIEGYSEWFINQENTYQLSINLQNKDFKEVLDQILSTFKFITVTPTSSPSAQTKGGITTGTPVKIKSIALTTATGPLVIKGTVDSGWMFEGVMPVLLLDSSRNEIASGSATEVTPGSWQTGNPVNFSVSFTFTTETTSGFLVFKNDNPSGLPENQKTFELPVKFAQR